MTLEILDSTKFKFQASCLQIRTSTRSQEGMEFHACRPRDEPVTIKDHAPGVKSSPYDYAPEFAAKTHPPSTAPRQDTHKPYPETGVSGQALDSDSDAFTSASDTLSGATSQSVYNDADMSKPLQGQEDGSYTTMGAVKGRKSAAT
jgi:hypothetical protein